MAKRKTKAPTTHEGAVDAKSTIQPRIYIEHPDLRKVFSVPLDDFLHGDTFTDPWQSVNYAVESLTERMLQCFATTIAECAYAWSVLRCLRIDPFERLPRDGTLTERTSYIRLLRFYILCLDSNGRSKLLENIKQEKCDGAEPESIHIRIPKPTETVLRWLTYEHETLLPPSAFYHALRCDFDFGELFLRYLERQGVVVGEKTLEFVYYAKPAWQHLTHIICRHGLPTSKVEAVRVAFKVQRRYDKFYRSVKPKSKPLRYERLIPLARLYLHCALAEQWYLKPHGFVLPQNRLVVHTGKSK